MSNTEPTNHSKYVNREFSWLQFNARVLSEALNEKNPLLERVKFLAIFESNLDEFYMVRVSGLIEQLEAGLEERTPEGLSPSEQLTLIAESIAPLRERASEAWQQHLHPQLQKSGIHIKRVAELKKEERKQLRKHFQNEVFALLTPLMLHPAITFPFISNRSLNLIVGLQNGGERNLARIKITTLAPLLIPVPNHIPHYVLLEDLIIDNLDLLFPGVNIFSAQSFRVLRDADIEIRELEAADLIDAVEKSLRLRRFGDPVLLEIEDSAPPEAIEVLRRGLELHEPEVQILPGPLNFEFLWEVAGINRPDLKFPSHAPAVDADLSDSKQLFKTIARHDVLLHHPYGSFEQVQVFVGSISSDPDVVGIKQTLYRVGTESPVVESLLEGVEQGKQVAAMVELKARFDESNNLIWSKALERAGAHVTYGRMDLKVHCKMCLILRREKGKIHTYAHLGTGNYNPNTARLYTDLGFLTDDPAICKDVSELFNYLTGFSKQTKFRKLLVAPHNLRDHIVKRIKREIRAAQAGNPARIAFKLNSLVDPEVIDALYAASAAGVQVDLVVRGICCLRPRVKGLSENIRVVSVVGRFLEHCRIYAFENGGKPEAYIGSADMMRRNLDRRVEVLVPIEHAHYVRYLVDEVIGAALKDNQQAWQGLPDGTYARVSSDEEPFDSQTYLMTHLPPSPWRNGVHSGKSNPRQIPKKSKNKADRKSK